MKKVCFFNSTPFWGGGEKLILDHALYFKLKGKDVTVACSRNSVLSQRCIAQGIRVMHIQVSRITAYIPWLWPYWIRFWKKNAFDTVFVTTSHDAKLMGITAYAAGVRNRVYLRGLAVAVKNSILNRWLFRKGFTHIIANSEATRNMISLRLGAEINSRIRVIYHGIDTYAPQQKESLASFKNQGNGIVFGNAARLTLQKGQLDLLLACKLLKNKSVAFTLLIAGSGPLEEELKKQISLYGLEKEVKLLGFVEDMEQFMQTIDVLVFPSHWEGFGFAIAEAMKHAKPVIAYHISSNPELIVHEKTGLLIPIRDTAGFAEAMHQLATHPDTCMHMGLAGKKRVEDEFCMSTQIEKVIAYIEYHA